MTAASIPRSKTAASIPRSKSAALPAQYLTAVSAEASPADLGSELDFLASALDMIVSEQDKMELAPPDVHESWNQREDSLYREDSPMQV